MKNEKEIKARYIVSLYKSLNKSLEYAVDMIVWYTYSDKEEKEVCELVKKYWI